MNDDTPTAKFMKDVFENIDSIKKGNKDKFKYVIIDAIKKIKKGKEKNANIERSPPLNICILNAPCNGFGDLIFAWKLYEYIKKWYNTNVIILTTLDSGLLKLGVNPEAVYGLETSKQSQCRRFKYLKLKKPIPKQDLLFVAPVQVDFAPDLKDVKYLFPYANMFNTFFFSEYNDTLGKHDFNLGIGGKFGKKRDGLFMEVLEGNEGNNEGNNEMNTENINKNTVINDKIPTNPYSIVYISDNVPGYENCINSFCSMVAKKYSKKVPHLDIIVPNWVEMKKSLVKHVSKYYHTVYFVDSKKQKSLVYEKKDKPKGKPNDKSKDKSITFRADVLPVPNSVMVSLIKNSLKDILITGDQSLSDVLSCCPDKNIFYQIAPWKESLGKELSKELPNKYLKSKRTTCGSEKISNYKSSYGRFIKKWNFKYIGKEKLDNVIDSVYIIKNSVLLQDITNVILNNKGVENIKNKIKDLQS
jgi:hypothetical protein